MSDQNQQMGQPQVGSDALFAVGDRVTWTHVYGSRNSMNLTTRRGVIDQILGENARVKMKNGKKEIVAFGRLTREGQKTELTRMVEAEIHSANSATMAGDEIALPSVHGSGSGELPRNPVKR